MHAMTTEYTGKLAEPIYAEDYRPKGPLDLTTPETYAARLNDELAERLDLLFEHYSIAPGDTTALVAALAIAHVPGMQFRAKNVPQIRWTPEARMELWATVEMEKARLREKYPRNKLAWSDAAICRKLLSAKEYAAAPWRTGEQITYPALTVELSRAKNPKRNHHAKLFAGADEDERQYLIESLIKNFAFKPLAS
jgi:hypothetical protein